MASSIVFHYLMIITIASSISSITGRYRQPHLNTFMESMAGLDNLNDEEMRANEYQYVRPQNPESFSRKYLLDADDRQLEEPASRPENRMIRYLGDSCYSQCNLAELKPRYIQQKNNIVCEVEITKGYFEQDGYEFFPSEYINKTCIYSHADPYKIESDGVRKPEVCLHNDNDSGCKTLYENLNVLKKNKNGNGHECWQHMVQLVAVGCKCNIHFTY